MDKEEIDIFTGAIAGPSGKGVNGGGASARKERARRVMGLRKCG